MSWIHVGSDETRVERMIQFGNHFWNNPTFNPRTNPYREWMSINFPQGRLGCQYCSTFLSVNPDEFGTKPSKKNAISKFI